MHSGKIITAVIDDGVNTMLYGTGDLQFDIEIDSDLKVKSREGRDQYAQSHGTICGAIIKKYAGGALIGSIKILDGESRRGEKRRLLKAVDWCVENGVKLVNMSLGTTDYRDFAEIRECINNAAAQGLIIVAACNNKNVYTVPACLTNVIGVRCRRIYTDGQYRYVTYTFDGIDIEASGRHLLTDASGRSRYTDAANSFAAPFVTAMAHEMLVRNPDMTLEDIRKELYGNALNYKDVHYNPYICMNTDWIMGCRQSCACGNCPEAAEPYEAGGTGTVVLDPDMHGYTDGAGVYKVMQHFSGIGKNIIYTGESTSEIQEWFLKQNKVRAWDCGLYKRLLAGKLSEKTPDIDIPVIAVCSWGASAVTESLGYRFGKDGYYPVTVSTDCGDVTAGFEYMSENMEAGRFLSCIYKKYNCDVILLKVHSMELLKQIEKSFNFDMRLFGVSLDIACTNADVAACTEHVDIMLAGDAAEYIDRAYSEILEAFGRL